MEINVENVVEKLKLYAGEFMDGQEPERDSLCRSLCGDCVQWVRETMKPEALAGRGAETQAALESLAAAEAFYQLAELDQANLPQTVFSPEIKLQLGDRVGHAQRLRDEKRLACAGLLREGGFYFGRI